MAKILIACEESQRICSEFRRLGHEAYSADIQECSGGHPEWHIQTDVLPLINGNCNFETSDGVVHKLDRKWDLIIAHPPVQGYVTLVNVGYTGAQKTTERQRKKNRKMQLNFLCAL